MPTVAEEGTEPRAPAHESRPEPAPVFAGLSPEERAARLSPGERVLVAKGLRHARDQGCSPEEIAEDVDLPVAFVAELLAEDAA
jgi:hypothetical protein